MMLSACGRGAGAIAAAAIISACNGTAAMTPAAAGAVRYIGTSAMPAVGSRATRFPPGLPPIVPETLPQSEYYEYVINNYGSYATMFDYPHSATAIGYIRGGIGGQGCTNVLYGYGKKNFWIVAGANEINEYAVPKHLVRHLSDSAGAPSSCAMSATGDLAVGVLFGDKGGDVVVYTKASGHGRAYATPLVREYFDGYDARGDIFADGFDRRYKFELVELPKGRSTFVRVKTSNVVNFPGSVQWDGTYLDVTDQGNEEVYQYSIDGQTLTLRNTIYLSGSNDCAQTWIATKFLYCADAGDNKGYAFKYPAGGSPVAALTGRFDLPLGTVAASP